MWDSTRAPGLAEVNQVDVDAARHRYWLRHARALQPRCAPQSAARCRYRGTLDCHRSCGLDGTFWLYEPKA